MRLLRDGYGANGSRSRLRHGFQRLPLVLHIAFHGRNKIGDFIVPLLQQNIDVRPGPIIVIAKADQLVVKHDDISQKSGYEEESCCPGYDAGAHEFLAIGM